jgi:hypothetical protein
MRPRVQSVMDRNSCAVIAQAIRVDRLHNVQGDGFYVQLTSFNYVSFNSENQSRGKMIVRLRLEGLPSRVQRNPPLCFSISVFLLFHYRMQSSDRYQRRAQRDDDDIWDNPN